MAQALDYQSVSVSRLRIPYIRWIIAFLLFLAAVLNYVDRNVLGLLAPTIQKELAINDDQYAMVVNAFLVAYTIAYVLSGRVVDWLGARVSMSIFLGFWSLANAITAFASSVFSLGVFRFMLGLGEAGCWTASPKAISEWFPARERGLAVGLYSIGGSVGATIAPLLVIFLATNHGWQGAFVITGLAGFVWLVPWIWIYRKPAEHPHITPHEREVLGIGVTPANTKVEEAGRPSELALWGRVFSQPMVWSLMLARLLTDAVWYFYLFWMPKYLNTERGVDQKHLTMMWVIFLAADFGFLGGGFLSGRLVKRGVSPQASRLWIMLICAVLVPVSPLVAHAPTVTVAMMFAMIVALAHAAWLSNISSLVVDLIPKNVLATTFGVIAGGSALGGIFMNQFVAFMVKNYSYKYCFYIMAVAHPIALCLIWWLRKKKGSDEVVA